MEVFFVDSQKKKYLVANTMLDKIIALLEQFNIPTDVIDNIRSQINDNDGVDKVKGLLEQHSDKIPNLDEVTSKLEGLNVVDDLKSGDVGGAVDSVKGMIGM